MSVKSYIESNKDRFLEELFSLIRIPSISTSVQRWAHVNMSGLFSCLALIDGMRIKENNSSRKRF